MPRVTPGLSTTVRRPAGPRPPLARAAASTGTRALRTQVLTRLQQGWSPEQVAGRLAREAGRPVISHESIYRFIDAQIRRTNDFRLAPLSATGQVQTGPAGAQRRQPRLLYRPPRAPSPTARPSPRTARPPATGRPT